MANFDGAQLAYMAWWDPPVVWPEDDDEDWSPFRGVSEGMDYGIERSN